MTNKQAAKILRRMETSRDAEFDEAIRLAIAALIDPVLERKKAGAKGGQARAKKYKARDFARWGKMGGRPKKAAP